MARPAPHWKDNVSALAPAERASWIAVLPLGAHEQHGPHLPPETDAIIATGLVERTIARLPTTLPVTFLPTEAIGYSIEHADFAVTRSLSYDEAISRWLAIAEDLSRLGIRKLVLFNAHGGNSPLITIATTEARVRFNMLAVATSWTRFGQPQGLIDPADKAIDIHGGDIETSVMLALAPAQVKMEKAAAFPSRQSDFIRDFTHLRAYGPHAFGWKMQDLNDEGVAGNAAAATAERGEQLIDHAVTCFIELLEDVDRFDLSMLR
ncbi:MULTISPECIES: creatininase family protein [unclassified Rhizobium]|uniref:creatininase family protein n=1 Tax=unclassified Rhizobium TaxID=2613769 RepID=UPI0006F75B7D|nr:MULTISPECIES: creatininase family protein [unclassified Rhizobium]KQV35040.1 creatininase [Rhizobium sp. Root1212]KRD24845.1 creatininase [Rhizobium sp. Root268]